MDRPATGPETAQQFVLPDETAGKVQKLQLREAEAAEQARAAAALAG